MAEPEAHPPLPEPLRVKLSLLRARPVFQWRPWLRGKWSVIWPALVAAMVVAAMVYLVYQLRPYCPFMFSDEQFGGLRIRWLAVFVALAQLILGRPLLHESWDKIWRGVAGMLAWACVIELLWDVLDPSTFSVCIR